MGRQIDTFGCLINQAPFLIRPAKHLPAPSDTFGLATSSAWRRRRLQGVWPVGRRRLASSCGHFELPLRPLWLAEFSSRNSKKWTVLGYAYLGNAGVKGGIQASSLALQDARPNAAHPAKAGSCRPRKCRERHSRRCRRIAFTQ